MRLLKCAPVALLCASLCVAPSSFAADPVSTPCGPGSVIVRPEVINDVLTNPGMGFTSFNRPNDAPVDGDGWYPQTTIAYYRWYWRDVEPSEGAYQFDLVDSALSIANACGQRLAFRIMPAALETNAVPAWFLAKGTPVVEQDGAFIPDFNNSTYLAAAERLIAAFGKRYDGNPSIDHVDIGMVGLWGEWHVSGIPNGKAVLLSTGHRIIDAYRAAFPHTILLLPINTLGGQMRAKTMGIGWRADCLGDCCNFFSPTFSHHAEYPRILSNAGITEQWRVAPVAFEVCWDVPTWFERGYDVEKILQYALDLHCSMVNLKSVGVPVQWKPSFEAFQKRVGYRFVIDEVCHPRAVAAGDSLNFKIRWKNVGVAPPYQPYRIAYRLRSSTNEVVWAATSDVNVSGWVPGTRSVMEAFRLSAIPSGVYSLDVSMLHPTENRAIIRFANAGRCSDGWYAVSTVTVR